MTADGWLCSRSNVKGKVTGLVKYQPQPVVRGDRTRHGALCDTRRRTRPVWTHLKSQMVISAQTWWKLSSYVTVCECHIEIKGYLITYFRHVTYDSPHRTKSIRRWKILGTPVKPKDIRFGWRKLSCAYVLRQWVCCNTQCTKPNRILKGIQAIVNRRQWITIVDSDSVKLSVVHAKAKSPPFGPAQRYLPTDLLLALLCNASSFRRLRFGLCWINLSSVSLGFGCHCSWFRSTSFRFVHIPLAKIGKTLRVRRRLHGLVFRPLAWLQQLWHLCSDPCPLHEIFSLLGIFRSLIFRLLFLSCLVGIVRPHFELESEYKGRPNQGLRWSFADFEG